MLLQRIYIDISSKAANSEEDDEAVMDRLETIDSGIEAVANRIKEHLGPLAEKVDIEVIE